MEPHHQGPELRPTHGGPSPAPIPAYVPPADPSPPPPVAAGPRPAARAAGTPGSGNRGKSLGLAAVAVAAIAGFLFLTTRPVPQPEASAPAWAQHVRDLDQRHRRDHRDLIKWVDRGGVASYLTSGDPVALGEGDRDPVAAKAVRSAIASGGLVQARSAIQEAQSIPAIPPGVKGPEGQPIVPLKPEISAGMARQIESGDLDFFHLYLYDTCDEDGDIVEVLIDGKPFAIVPITREGATLSVPFGKAPTKVEIRGIYDGGGSITVGCRSSNGDGFMRGLEVGEIQTLSIVAR